MDEQMRLFESEIRQQNNFRPGPPQGFRPGGPQGFRPPPSFMPSSVRAHMPHHGGGGMRGGHPGGMHHGGGPPQQNYGGSAPPPPSYPRPQYIHQPNPAVNQMQARQSLTPLPRPPNLVQKEFTALPVLNMQTSEQDDDDDIMATLMKYEQEVKEEKGGDKKKRKSDEQGGSSNKFSKNVSDPRPAQKSGTEVTPEEIKKKAKQMVEAVKASQVIEKTKKVNQQNSKGGKKNKKMIRMAGGQMWEDSSLLGWDTNDYRLFCGDLGNDVTDEVLNRTFGKYTSFQQARVIRDKRTNKTKGYGFVSFKDPADFTKAIKEMDGKYVGSRPIKLRRSCWKERNIDQ
jgi:hypothetical protein